MEKRVLRKGFEKPPFLHQALNNLSTAPHSQCLALCYHHPAAGMDALHPALAPAAAQRLELACATISLAQRKRAK